MKRDMDLVREILLRVESNPALNGNQNFFANREGLGITDYTDQEIVYNAVQLVEAGYLTGNVRMAHAGMVIVTKLTWRGHDFLNDIRDPEIWRKTKERAKGVANVGVGFLWEIAKAEIRMKVGM